MLPGVCSVIDHRWYQNVARTKRWHTSCQVSVSLMFLPHFDVLCDLIWCFTIMCACLVMMSFMFALAVICGWHILESQDRPVVPKKSQFSLILLITHMITDWLGLPSVLLPLLIINFGPYQLICCQICMFHFPSDVPPQFHLKLNLSKVRCS